MSKNLKIKYQTILGGQCKICGYKKSNKALHFHHKDPSQKLFEITSAIWGVGSYTESQISEEVLKCELLCANCHAEIHD